MRSVRESQTRELSARKKAWAPRNLLQELSGVLGPDKTLYLARTHCLGDEDQTRVGGLMVNGWTPVKAEQLPGYEYLKGPDGNVRFSGGILMQNSTEECESYLQHCEDVARGTAKSANSEFEQSGSNLVSTEAKVTASVTRAPASSK